MSLIDPKMSQLMRLWHLLTSVNSFFKGTCAAIQGARCLIFDLTLCLLPYLMCANSNGSEETVRMRRLAWAFAGRLYDKNHNLMSWLKRCRGWRFWCSAILLYELKTCKMSCHAIKPTKWSVHPAKTQISLGIRPVWSIFTVYSVGGWGPKVSSCGQRRLDQTGQMPRLIWVFAGCTGYFVGFVMG